MFQIKLFGLCAGLIESSIDLCLYSTLFTSQNFTDSCLTNGKNKGLKH